MIKRLTPTQFKKCVGYVRFGGNEPLHNGERGYITFTPMVHKIYVDLMTKAFADIDEEYVPSHNEGDTILVQVCPNDGEYIRINLTQVNMELGL